MKKAMQNRMSWSVLVWAFIVVATSLGAGGAERREDALMERYLKHADRMPEALQADLESFRASRNAIWEKWNSEYKPNENATLEEVRTARRAFRRDYGEEIEANRRLRVRLMQDLRRFGGQARELYGDYRATREKLTFGWKAVREELGEDATQEELAAAKARFQESNAKLIARQRQLEQQASKLAGFRAGGSDEDLSPELSGMREGLSGLRRRVRARQQQAREEMRGLSRKQRLAYRRALREELRELQEEWESREDVSAEEELGEGDTED